MIFQTNVDDLNRTIYKAVAVIAEVSQISELALKILF